MTLLADLFQRQAVWRGGAPLAAPAAVPTGFKALDAELPGGGWPAGALAEAICGAEGIGELQIVLPALAALTSAGYRAAWLAPPHLPYAPALRAAGVRLEGLTVVRAPGRRDTLWAAEEALRAGAFRVLLAWLPRAGYAELRRLALAAQAGPGFALAFRPPGAESEASPAALRLLLEPAPESGRVAVRILKRRGGPASGPLRLPIERPLAARPPAGPGNPDALDRASFPRTPAAGALARACVA